MPHACGSQMCKRNPEAASTSRMPPRHDHNRSTSIKYVVKAIRPVSTPPIRTSRRLVGSTLQGGFALALGTLSLALCCLPGVSQAQVPSLLRRESRKLQLSLLETGNSKLATIRPLTTGNGSDPVWNHVEPKH